MGLGRIERALASADRRWVARGILGLVVTAAAAAIMLTGQSLASGFVIAQTPTPSPTNGSPSPSPSPEESPTAEPTEPPPGPAITLLNPAEGYSPDLSDFSESVPQISDKNDGVDETYHIVAQTKEAPSTAIVEAYWEPSGDQEVLVGELERSSQDRNAWAFNWDIPPDFDEGDGIMRVKLFGDDTPGAAPLNTSEEPAEIDTAEETVEITWPSNGGPLGFYKPQRGSWRTVIDGSPSENTQRVDAFYTTTRPGLKADYQQCGRGDPNGPATPFQVECVLASAHTPAMVTAVALVAEEGDDPLREGEGLFLTQDSADAHRVKPYIQDPHDLSVTVNGVPPSSRSASYPTGERRVMESGCLVYQVSVTDTRDRPVQGVNVDVHIDGPGDQIAFGNQGSSKKLPDQGPHEAQDASNCSGGTSAQQGHHDVPAGHDVKHVESIQGTGSDGGNAGFGKWRFSVFSPGRGVTDITAWIDDRPLDDPAEPREADNDVRGPAEPFATAQAQWLPRAAQLFFDPSGDASVLNECQPFTVKARAGSAVLAGVNVDVHAQGPTDELDFCIPPNGAALRAPDQGDHTAEDDTESSHDAPTEDESRIQHTEGETDEDGNLVIGIISASKGETSLDAWIDGEAGFDNDSQDSGEPSGEGSNNWVASAEDANVNLVNPSGYGGVNIVSNAPDANSFYHVIARVDAPEVIEGIEILISSDGGASFARLGDASRVGATDTWEFLWNVLVDDDGYVLRARIKNTQKTDDEAIEVDNGAVTADITQPSNTGEADFTDNATTVQGVAHGETEIIELFYSTTPAGQDTTWSACGTIELEGGSEESQEFAGNCQLEEDDRPAQVTGLAALPFDCDPDLGCDQPVVPPEEGAGDAHVVTGVDVTPVVTFSPDDGRGPQGSCQTFRVIVRDTSGEPITGTNVDVHMAGPGDGIRFCDPPGDGSGRRAPDQGDHEASDDGNDEAVHAEGGTHHTEGETNANGRFVIGIESDEQGSSQIVAWVDTTEDDEQGETEPFNETTFRWVEPGECTIFGSSGDDVIRGTSGDDVICGFGGDDTLLGEGGDDTLIGGAGQDSLQGGDGRDELRGGGDKDSLRGGNGRDLLKGGDKNDLLVGGGARDRLRGQNGFDTLRGNQGNDVLVGARGDDLLAGGNGNDLLKGGAGDDVIKGFTGEDRLRGGGGDDILRGGRDNDDLRGGAGNDILYGGQGRDTCDGGSGNNVLRSC